MMPRTRQHAAHDARQTPWQSAIPADTLPNESNATQVWKVPTVLLVLAVFSIAIDLPLARFCRRENCPDILRELFAVAETFGNGLSVALIGLAIWMLDPPGRIRLPRMVTAVVLAGLAADVCKLILARTRPRSFDMHSSSIWESFGPLFPINTIQSTGQSFPSAHTATAVAFAVMMAWAYPRGRWLFTALAVMVGLQRVETSAHFLSDTFVGGAIGWAAGMHMLHPNACFGWTAQVERWLHRKFTASAEPVVEGIAERQAA